MKNKIKNSLIKLGYFSKPDFIIIGVQKSGTSALYDILKQHSLICGASKKEIHYFDNEQWYSKQNISKYHSFFPLPYQIKKGTKLFEATPSYILTPIIAQRIHLYNPNIKLILVLRNPADRAFSAWTMYHHNFKSGKHQHLRENRTFSEAITEEINNLKNGFSKDKNIYNYLERGIYHSQIENYLKYFNKNQLLILENTELREYHSENMQKIQSFINVPYEEIEPKSTNKSSVSEKEIYKSELLKLKEFYRPYNEKLFQLINKKYDWE